jgi:hypothetical protein
MPDREENPTSIEALRQLLPQLPLDADQRASVSHNLDFVDEAVVDSVLHELRSSLGALQNTVQELESMMAPATVEVVHDPIPAEVYELSAIGSA